MAIEAEGRPRTLDEVKAALRTRLETRRHPLRIADREAAREAIEQLDGLDGERWASTWLRASERFERAAHEAEARGDRAAAADAFRQAYAFAYAGRYPCPNHPRKEEAARKARDLYLRAGQYVDPPLERVSVPFDGRPGEGREVVVLVRRPKGVARPPVVVLWGGIDGYKEERYEVGDPLVEAGCATVAVDMPGTGESPILGSVDAERQYTPIFEWIQAQPDLDGTRIGCVGSSFGGYWATKLAHTHRAYLRCAVSWGGGAHLNFQAEWAARSRFAESYLMDLAETRAHMMGLSTYEAYVERVPSFSLLDQGVLDRPCAPLLLVNGKDDRQVPIEDLYLVLEHGDPKSARVFPGGHMGHTPDTLPTVVRWLLGHLAT